MKRTRSSSFMLLAALVILMTGCTVGTPPAGPSGTEEGQVNVEIRGTLDSITNDTWIVNGRTISVSDDIATAVDATVGDEVFVLASELADGTLEAVRITLASDGNTNDNVNENGNANANANINQNVNVNANANDNGNTNANTNANANDNDNTNANTNVNANDNGNDNKNENANNNDNDDDDNENENDDDD